MRIHHPRWGGDGCLQRPLLGDQKIIGTFGKRSCAYAPGTVCLNRRRERGDGVGDRISIGNGDLVVLCTRTAQHKLMGCGPGGVVILAVRTTIRGDGVGELWLRCRHKKFLLLLWRPSVPGTSIVNIWPRTTCPRGVHRETVRCVGRSMFGVSLMVLKPSPSCLLATMIW
jgi:hypothetical protein